MTNSLTRGRKVLFYAMTIACVFAIVKTLYDTGYYPYRMSEAFRYKNLVKETVGYRIYDSDVLKAIISVFFYAGLVGVYALWKKPRPIGQVFVVIAAGSLPKLVLDTINKLVITNMDFFEYYSNTFIWWYAALTLFFLIWTIARLILIAKLYTDADKYAKLVLAAYMIIFIIGIIRTDSFLAYLLYGRISETGNYEYVEIAFAVQYYIANIVYIFFYVMAIVYLKKSLGEDMPFTKTLRFVKKECTNKLLED